MPNIASAKKRLRQNIVLRERNKSFRSKLRNRCKKVVKLVAAANQAEAESNFLLAVKILDKAGAKKIIHKNAAARKKSRLSKLLKKMKTAAAA